MLDKFYTNRDVSNRLIKKTIEKIPLMNNYLIVEPSAGDGAFSDYLREHFDDIIALDISPDKDYILKQDFFDFNPETNKKIVTIGNPPFGRISSLAYRFYEKAFEFSDYVCFLVPRTFKRYSFLKKMNDDFHLIYQEDVPIGSFEPKNMAAKTVFQIWEKRDYKRKIANLNDTTEDFKILHRRDLQHSAFAVRAYGSNCGEISFDIKNLAPKSWHFIVSYKSQDLVIRTIKSIDFSFSKDTVRQDSVGAKELIHYYNEQLDKS